MQEKTDSATEASPRGASQELEHDATEGYKTTSSRGRRRRRTDWRLGGRSVRKWDQTVLVAALGFGGLGILGASILGRIFGAGIPLISLGTLWAGLALAIGFAFVRSRPAGLLKFRGQDLLWGLGLGLVLRLTQGVLSGANSLPFPSLQSVSGLAPAQPSVFSLTITGVIGPVVEELFFRAVLLVVVYQLLRRFIGGVAAAATAALVSAGGFVCLHAVFNPLTLPDSLQVMILGLVLGLTVILTGRLWPAVVAHVVYNSSFLLLAVLGTVLA